MTRKVYRTAQGKMVDLGALQLQNETVRAVGNMSVNARGDLVDADNRPISTRNKQVSSQYSKQTTNVSETRLDHKRKSNRTQKNVVPDIPPPPEDFNDDFVKEEVALSAPAPAVPESSGLAAAIARAREVKQEPLPQLRTQRPGTQRI
jgi:hypothetical protein